ncbi:MAG: hypothetical protein JW828_15465, partial [Sedimentisphaerales bacterium]|nr:hypothetical protein [Sedimentisphaerales bacterium]
MDGSHKSAAEMQKKGFPSSVEPLRKAGSGSAVQSRVVERLRCAQQDLEQARNHYTTVFNLAPVGYIAVYEDTVVKEI